LSSAGVCCQLLMSAELQIELESFLAGLKDAAGGQSGIVMDVDDILLKRKVRSIARADVAELCVQALRIDAAKNRSVDVINDTEVPAPKTKTDIEALFTNLKANCDYSINPAP
jgi:hypothetical protein